MSWGGGARAAGAPGEGPAGRPGARAHVGSGAGTRRGLCPCGRGAITRPLARRTKANMERTFIAIKPDGVQRGLVGDIIKRFEQKGFRLVAMKFLTVRAPLSPRRSSVAWAFPSRFDRVSYSRVPPLLILSPAGIPLPSALCPRIRRRPFPKPGSPDALGKVKRR